MKNNIIAKKSLGQHFLKSEAIIKEIVDTADLREGDLVLEIGPGKGDLTQKLLQSGARVLAVEKDRRLIEELRQKFEAFSDRFVLLEKDILDFRPELVIKEPYKLVANIPYYITGLVLRKFLESRKSPTLMVLLVQKEVAERITETEKESLLSISVKAYGEPKFIRTVKAGSFSPPPKVDSAIILISNISKDLFKKNKIGEKRFFEIVKAGFAHNRKKLSSNLKDLVEKNKIEKYLAMKKLNPSSRAEDLKIEQWCEVGKIENDKTKN